MSHVLPLVRFVEDDEVFRTSQELLLRTHGFEVEGYGSVQEFLAADDLSRPGMHRARRAHAGDDGP